MHDFSEPEFLSSDQWDLYIFPRNQSSGIVGCKDSQIHVPCSKSLSYVISFVSNIILVHLIIRELKPYLHFLKLLQTEWITNAETDFLTVLKSGSLK